MVQFFRQALAPLVLGLIAAAVPMAARSAETAPKPETYLCPNATGGAVDCFLHAVEHLYTMCRQVKSIEIIEFGYEASDRGTNSAKSEYCVDKQKLNITRPYQAALREATVSKQAVDGVRGLHELWNASLVALKWRPGESDDDYKSRTAAVYAAIDERIVAIRQYLAGAPAGRAVAAGTPAKAPR